MPVRLFSKYRGFGFASIIGALAVVAGIVLLHAPGLSADDAFIGPEACGACHPDQYAAWKKGPHVGSFFGLDPEKRKDSKCVGCHGERLEGVMGPIHCETCHGGGRHYAKDNIMRDHLLAEAVGLKVRDLTGCLRCHHGETPNLHPFEAKSAWKRLPHADTAKPEPHE